MRLEDCIKNPIVGQNCEKLGQIQGPWYGRYKVFLSYSQKNEWELIKLNTFQLLLRNYLGFYKTTHLDLVTKKINKYSQIEDNAACAKIQSLWMKKNLVFLGNCDLSEARVICFAETHGDKNFRSAISRLINENSKIEDVTLVEGVGINDKNLRSHQQVKDLKPHLIIKGWDREDFEKINALSAQLARDKYAQLLKIHKSFTEGIKTTGNWTSQEIIELEGKIDQLVKDIADLNEYYKHPHVTTTSKKAFQIALEDLKKNPSSEEYGKILIGLCTLFFQKMEKKQEAAFHKNMTPEALSQILGTVDMRNASLIESIESSKKTAKEFL